MFKRIICNQLFGFLITLFSTLGYRTKFKLVISFCKLKLHMFYFVVAKLFLMHMFYYNFIFYYWCIILCKWWLVTLNINIMRLNNGNKFSFFKVLRSTMKLSDTLLFPCSKTCAIHVWLHTKCFLWCRHEMHPVSFFWHQDSWSKSKSLHMIYSGQFFWLALEVRLFRNQNLFLTFTQTT